MGLFLESFWSELILVLIGLISFGWYKFTSKYKHFDNKNIPVSDYKYLLGSVWKPFLRKEHFAESMDQIYKKYKDSKLIGMFLFWYPGYLATEPSLINEILIKDFSSFHDRSSPPVDYKKNPLEAHLVSLKGETWKWVRSKQSPTFTSGKLKWMFPLMEEAAENLLEYIEKDVVMKDDLNIKSIFSRYAIDVIASCAFGLDGSSMKDPNCDFVKMSEKLLNPSKLQFLKGMLRAIIPFVRKYLNIKALPDDTADYFVSITKQTLEHREKTGEVRTDFVQILLDLKKADVERRNALKEKKEGEDKKESEIDIEMTDEVLAAQAMIFFLAGFENIATTMGVFTYFISKHQSCQEKLRKELEETVAKHGSLNYQAISEMEYLDACMNEAMRIVPLGSILSRGCTKDYTLPDGTVIAKDEFIMIPVWSIQRDERYFPDPLTFKPERFIDSKPIPGTFMPFGDGPRICIAQRFALIEMKLGVCKLLQKYKLLASSKNIEPLQFDPSKQNRIKGDLWVKLEKL